MNPVWQQKKLTEFCKANGIIVAAFSPLGAKGVSWGTNEVMDNEVLKEIAKTHGKTVAQVLLCSFKDCRGSKFIYKRLIWCMYCGKKHKTLYVLERINTKKVQKQIICYGHNFT